MLNQSEKELKKVGHEEMIFEMIIGSIDIQGEEVGCEEMISS